MMEIEMEMALISDRLKQVLRDLETVTTIFENLHAEQKTAVNDDFLNRKATPPKTEE